MQSCIPTRQVPPQLSVRITTIARGKTAAAFPDVGRAVIDWIVRCLALPKELIAIKMAVL